MKTPTLMIQGTASDVGKSALTAALCRALARRGVRVAPFKPQNMALNSAVTEDGGEIGRAQAVQAQAARIAPLADMNPVLLKPNADTGAQVIIQGRAIGNLEALDYRAYKPVARAAVLESYARLAGRFEAIVVEGAGSPAEVNLREGDIANMGFAEAADCPVLLIGDIDRGGVFAQLVGTLALLSDSERARVKGFVVNRFRGDLALLEPGLRWLERETGKPVLGVLPFVHGLHLEAEDAVATRQDAPQSGALRTVVPVLPHIGNHTDFDPLRLHPQVDLRFVGPHETPPPADWVILPGSKSVRADLEWLRRQGWEDYLNRHLRYGGKLLGICGGFQMLGQTICDPHGLEGPPGKLDGFGWLELDTELAPEKRLSRVRGTLSLEDAEATGYEIHAGVSSGPALRRPFAYLAASATDAAGTDGACSKDGQILGTYWHGLFESAPALAALLRWAGLREAAPLDYVALRERAIDLWTDTVESHLDMRAVENVLWNSR